MEKKIILKPKITGDTVSYDITGLSFRQRREVENQIWKMGVPRITYSSGNTPEYNQEELLRQNQEELLRQNEINYYKSFEDPKIKRKIWKKNKRKQINRKLL